MLPKKNQCVVTIAGSDSSGGAGIQADIKTISATGSYAASVITALTAQNTQGVQAIQEISSCFVEKQIQSVFEDMPVSAVKIGMLHNQNIIRVVAAALQTFKPQHVVLDPVMIAKSGHALLDENQIEYLKQFLFAYVTLITPNLPEAEKLLKIKITNSDEQAIAAKQLGDQFKVNVLIKGGHLTGAISSDVLYLHEHRSHTWFHAERIDSHNTHGTGCSLSSAIASYLAQGFSLNHAVDKAKQYLTQAILTSRTWKLGHGNGPIAHFYFLDDHYGV